jgi:deoxyribonuclease (pyrimidine dimer)
MLHPFVEGIPPKYVLGKGHIKFFKNKLLYLSKRHEIIKEEMRNRGFQTRIKIILLPEYEDYNKDYIPTPEAIQEIKERIIWKLGLKPSYYRYYGEGYAIEWLQELIKKATVTKLQ